MAALFLQLFFLFFGSCVCYESEEFIVAPAGLAEAPYPEWAHYHWLVECDLSQPHFPLFLH